MTFLDPAEIELSFTEHREADWSEVERFGGEIPRLPLALKAVEDSSSPS